ncbi:PD-(D/E)XK nuclease family protein [Alistipes sp. OttesenSCG-928-B03]|nr:PD-(D/E)XK nuclease family protein [Alistipes sp. OttesenSCG-928-B03]
MIDRPVWQPRYATVDELMEEAAGIRTGDHIRLIAELYKAYSRYHEESFDSFYFWGETLLADFDQIDKYLIDAKMLFRNIADLKNIDDDFEYLNPEQREIIARFWSSFGREGGYSQEQQKFLGVWNTLGAIYSDYRQALSAAGLAYTGMVYRTAAEKIKPQGAVAGILQTMRQGVSEQGEEAGLLFKSVWDKKGASLNDSVFSSDMEPKNDRGEDGEMFTGQYVIIGFNALSECEKILFDHLASKNGAEFFWDYDHYYLDNREQEAGLFMYENVRRYQQKTPLPYDYAEFSRAKSITVAEAPSNSMQCKYIAEYLADAERILGRKPGQETAIVLTDESLLVPALYSIPDNIEKINVTMGYPLKLTLAYSFAERLIGLQSRKRGKSGQTSYYHDDVTGLLTHPYVLEASGGVSGVLAQQVIDRQQIYTDLSAFELPQGVDVLFASAEDTWRDLAGYIKIILSHFVEPKGLSRREGRVGTESEMQAPRHHSVRIDGRQIADNQEIQQGNAPTKDVETERRQRIGFFTVIAESLDKVVNSIDGCGIEVSTKVFATLLRRVLQSATVAYKGEPLEGVQVMGILETRNLDFENVLLLSVNDDNFPGNLASSPSFIPYNLRLAYGLPTPQHHEGVYAYYFYRLLQRASNIHLAYSSHSDEKSNGEQSRYIYQLEYESPHKLARRRMALNVSVGAYEPIEVAKDGAVIQQLAEFTSAGGTRRLSPTSLYNYVRCPLKFYFHSVARLETENRIAEEIDAPVFGTILHRAMELLYRPLVRKQVVAEDVAALYQQVESAVESAVRDEYFKGADVATNDYSGNLQLVADIVRKYIFKCILPFDEQRGEFRVVELEKRVDADFAFGTSDEGAVGQVVALTGIADRIDEVHGCLWITDYKTGAVNREFKGVEALFSPRPADQNPAAFQTMLYSMMLAHEAGQDAVPSIYAVREMNRDDYSPLLVDKQSGCEVLSFRPYEGEFAERFATLLAELFNTAIPFTQCEDPKTCRYCDFNVVCKR